MPDLMTHLASAYLISRPAAPHTVRIAPETALFCLGGVLPDLLSRATMVAMPYAPIRWLIMPWHTPAGLAVLCLLIAFALPEANRVRLLGWLGGGVCLHLALDSLQVNIGPGGYYWLFPFSDFRGQFGLFWPDQTVFIAPWLMAAAMVMEWRLRRRVGRAA